MILCKSSVQAFLGNLLKKSAPTTGLVGGLTLPSVVVVSAVTTESPNALLVTDNSVIALNKSDVSERELTPDEDPTKAAEPEGEGEGEGEGETDVDVDSDGEEDQIEEEDDDEEDEDEDEAPESQLRGVFNTFSNFASGIDTTKITTKYQQVKESAGKDPYGGFKQLHDAYDSVMKFFGEDTDSSESGQGEPNSSNGNTWWDLVVTIGDTLLEKKDKNGEGGEAGAVSPED